MGPDVGASRPRSCRSGGQIAATSKPSLLASVEATQAFGTLAPASQRLITGWVTPMRSARACWVMPWRTRISFRFGRGLTTTTQYTEPA